MIRVGAVLALLASLGLAGALVLGTRQARYTGRPLQVDRDGCTLWVDEPFVMPPKTFPEDLGGFVMKGTGPDAELHLMLRFPEEVQGFAGDEPRIEILHDHLDLPPAGPIAGRTILRVGTAEWTDGPWRLRGAIAAISFLPIAVWAVATLPWVLLRKRARPQA